MNSVIHLTKDIALAILVAVVSLHTIVELLDSFGWLPGFIERPLRLRKKKAILETLEEAGISKSSLQTIARQTINELGLSEKVPWVRSVNHTLNIRADHSLPEAHPDLQKSLKEIASNYIEVGNFTIGSTSQQQVKYFVNLRHAFCAAPGESELDKRLAEIMLGHIRECFRSQGLSADAVVARKNGLNALAYLVARAMGVPLLLYTEDAAIWNPKAGEKPTSRPRYLDYQLPPETTAVIVDDSCVGGNSFKDLAQDLRHHQIRIKHAFVLFCRKEVDAVRALRGHGIDLHPLDTYSDADLLAMRASASK